MKDHEYAGTLPECYRADLIRIAETARREAEQSEHSVRFIFYTDPHHWPDGNQLRAAAAIRLLARELPLDAIVCGGDFSENGPKGEVVRSQNEIVNALRAPTCPLLPVKGNHDDNSIHDYQLHSGGTEHVIFPHETYENLLKPLEGIVSFDRGNESGLYYYYDIPGKRTRIVVLNAIDIPYETGDNGMLRQNGQWQYAFSDRQLIWMSQEALDFSGKPDCDRWKALIFSHVAILQDGVEGADHPVTGGEAMWDIIREHRSHVAACFFGHVHCDQVIVRDGIPMLSTLNGVTYGRGKDSIMETAFDVCSLNYAKGELVATRFGAGDSRTIRL